VRTEPLLSLRSGICEGAHASTKTAAGCGRLWEGGLSIAEALAGDPRDHELAEGDKGRGETVAAQERERRRCRDVQTVEGIRGLTRFQIDFGLRGR